MHQSHVIEIAGQFAGAAMSEQGRYRFVAVDPRVEQLDASLWGTIEEMRRAVNHLMVTGRVPVRH